MCDDVIISSALITVIKSRFKMYEVAFNNNGICVMLIESRLKRATDPSLHRTVRVNNSSSCFHPLSRPNLRHTEPNP